MYTPTRLSDLEDMHRRPETGRTGQVFGHAVVMFTALMHTDVSGEGVLMVDGVGWLAVVLCY
tara:strand:- start:143213 stop:143398 length:186 start_codon:yes stop_codon:yes gene_type:complete